MASKSLGAGVKYGLIASLIYVVLLILQFNFGAGDPVTFTIFKLLTYIIILVVFFFAAQESNKENETV